MKIRLAQLSDQAALFALSRALHEESRFRVYALDSAKVMQSIGYFLGDAKTRCLWLAENSDGTIIGMLAGYVMELFFARQHIAQDSCFYVLPAHRGSSAALKLLTAFQRWARNRQAQELCINMSTAIDQERFDRWLKRLGFTCCGSNFVLALAT